MLKRHPFFWTLLLSVLLHLLLLLAFTAKNILIWPFSKKQQSSSSEQAAHADPPIIFEIVDTVEESEPEPNQTYRLSDKTAHQQDMNQNRPLGEASNIAPQEQAVAYQAPLVSQSFAKQSIDHAMQEIEPVDEGYGAYQKPREQYARDFSINALLGKQAQAAKPAQPKSSTHIANTQADQSGMFQLNTYAWDFAPYLLQLKHRIEKNLYPPPAFNRLGIQGSHLIVFTILPDGRLTDLKILKQEGSNSLVETSRKALMVSAPFMPLPEDFPEEKLIITTRFNYILFANQ